MPFTPITRLILLFLWLLPLLARAELITDEALRALVREAPTAAQYPDEDAVALLQETEITVNADGSTITRERALVKMLTERGLPLAQWQVDYDHTAETLQVPVARTLINGYLFRVDERQIAESAVHPGAAWYDGRVVRRLPLVGLVNGICEVETVRTRATPRLPGAFSARLRLQQAYPVKRATYTLRVPAAWTLSIRRTVLPGPRVEETVDGDQRVYRWTLTDIPPLPRNEPLMPPVEEIAAQAYITSLTGWAPVAAWYAEITAGKAAVTADLRRVAEAHTAGCATPEAKIAALFAAVREIPYVGVELGELADVPHSAEEVARANYGDCKDKATLLKALLAAVGIDSHYLLVRTTDRGPLDATCYGPHEFNHVMLAVPHGEGFHYLDPTEAEASATMLPPGVEGAQGLLIAGAGQLVTLPVSAAEDNRFDVRIAATVGEDRRATGTATVTFTGQMAFLQRNMLAAIAPARYKDALEGTLAPRLGNEVVIDTLTVEGARAPERPLIFTLTFSSPNYLQPAGDRLVGTLPGLLPQPNRFLTAKERRTPFWQPMQTQYQAEAVITLPAGWGVAYLPTPVAHSCAAGMFTDHAAYKDGRLRYAVTITTRRGNYPPELLETYRDWGNILALQGRNGLQYYLRTP